MRHRDAVRRAAPAGRAAGRPRFRATRFGRAPHAARRAGTPALSVALLAAWLPAAACGARGGPPPAGGDAARPPAEPGRPGQPAQPAQPEPAGRPQPSPQPGGPPAPGRPAPGDTSPHAHTRPAPAGPGFTEADVAFMRDMIGHHEQAIVMARMALQRATRPEIRQLAGEIIAAQSAEIEQMKRWRAEWIN